MKRMVFLSCRCTSKSVDSSYDEEEEMNDEVIADDSLENLPTTLFYTINNNKRKTNETPINTVFG